MVPPPPPLLPPPPPPLLPPPPPPAPPPPPPLDSDDDTVPDGEEGTGFDTDSDGIPNHLDADSTVATTLEQLRSVIARALEQSRDMDIFLPPASYFRLGGEQLALDCGCDSTDTAGRFNTRLNLYECGTAVHVRLRSSGVGATLDGERLSRLFEVANGCRLSLNHINLIRGQTVGNGGAIRALQSGGVALHRSSVLNSSAQLGGGLYIQGTARSLFHAGSSTDGRNSRSLRSSDILSWRHTNVTLDDSRIAGCTAATAGGAALLSDLSLGDSVLFSGSELADNVAPAGSALYLLGAALGEVYEGAHIRNTAFVRNIGPTNATIVVANAELEWLCRPGSFAPVSGAIAGDIISPDCRPCASGYYGGSSPNLATEQCLGPCVEGHYCDAGTAEPAPCPAGTRMPQLGAGSRGACIPCSPGEYEPEGGALACLPCELGYYNPVAGRTFCEPCPPGGYCPTGGTTWLACPAGTYNEQEGRSSPEACQQCPPGTFSEDCGAVSVTTCAPCPANSFSAEAGSASCDVCTPPLTSGNGSSACDICSQGFYAADAALPANPPPSPPPPPSQQLDCPCLTDYPANVSLVSGELQVVAAGALSLTYPGTYGLHACSRHDSGLEPSCNSTDYPGWCEHEWCYVDPAACNTEYSATAYVVNATLHYSYTVCGFGNDFEQWFYRPSTPFLPSCKACPPDIECPLNTTLANLPLPDGYWRASSLTAEIYICDDSDTCASGKGTAARPPGTGRYCEDGHNGPLCEACVADDQYFDTFLRRCVGCPGAWRWGVLAGALGAALVIGAGIYVGMSAFEGSRPLLRRVVVAIWQPDVQSKSKLAISFLQVVVALNDVYDVPFHKNFSGWLTRIAFAKFNPIELTYPSRCLGSLRVRLLVDALWPFAAMLVIAGLVSGYAIAYSRWGGGRGWAKDARKVSRTVVLTSTVLLYLVLPGATRNVFRARLCATFAYNDALDESQSYLLADLHIQCSASDPDYRGLDAYFWSLFVLWPVCVPTGLLALLLVACRKEIRTGGRAKLADACSFLWLDYSQSLFFWEIVDMVRKLFLTSLILFVDTKNGSSKLLRLVVAAMTSALFVTCLAAIRPFKRSSDLYLACTANLLLTWFFIAGIVLKLCEEGRWPLTSTSTSCYTFAGITSSYNASATIVALTASMLVVLLLLGVARAINGVKEPGTIRLVSTGHEPSLSLPGGCSFHAFFSHSWSTGQDQTHAITRQLQLFVPGVRVWLDADYLDDLASLEQCIARSATFLIFLSRGYFRSVNCRRELAAALVEKRPVIAMREEDSGKGGASAAALREECDHFCGAEHVGAAQVIFDEPPVTWVRMRHFQLEACLRRCCCDAEGEERIA